jgi:phosphodiesterase/alkaline phosphatase D-like protein
MKIFNLVVILLLSICFAAAQTPAAPPAQAPAAAPVQAPGVTPAQAAAQAQTAGVTKGPAVEYVSDHDAVVAWTTKNPVDMKASFGTAANSMTQTADAVENSKGTNHRVKFNNLQPDTIYFYQMTASGQPVGAMNTFKTVPKGAKANHTYVDQSPK